MSKQLVFTGVGDIIIDRDDHLSALKNVRDVFRSSDVAYANMEQVLSDEGTPHPAQSVSRGSRFVEAYTDAQIDVVSCATNHALDWGTAGLLGTIETLDDAGVAHCGTGADLAEARKPAILDREGTTFGVLNYCSVARPEYDADEHNPGVAPLKVHTLYQQVDYQPATPPAIISRPTPESYDMIIEDVKRLKEQVDVVVVAFHWGQHLLPVVVPQYCVEMGRGVVDAGADIVIGSHTHILKGVEVYKGKSIFYSTGNFVLDFGKAFTDRRLIDGLDKHYFGGRPDDSVLAERDKTMIVKAYIEDKKVVQTGFIPCMIIDGDPTPVPRGGQGDDVVEYMRDITREAGFNAEYEWVSDDEVKIVVR